MKKLFQIGILLLFMIGLCSVQLDYSTSILVDDDVGVEFATNIANDAINIANDATNIANDATNIANDATNIANDAILITTVINNLGHIAAPLKYVVIAPKKDIINNRDSKVWEELTINCIVPIQVVTIIRHTNLSEISSTNLVNNHFKSGKGCQINTSGYISTNQSQSYRLDIGKNYCKT